MGDLWLELVAQVLVFAGCRSGLMMVSVRRGAGLARASDPVALV